MSVFDLRIETERLILRKLRRSDAEDMYEYTSDPEVTKYLSWETHADIQQTEKYIESVIAQYKNDHSYSWAIELKESKKFIGIVRIFDVSMSNKRGELSYIMNPGFQGRGLMSEAIQAIVELCFKELGLNRLQARCTEENISSEKVMQKIGMSYEGILYEYWINKGVPANAMLYAMIRKNFSK